MFICQRSQKIWQFVSGEKLGIFRAGVQSLKRGNENFSKEILPLNIVMQIDNWRKYFCAEIY